LGLQDAVVNMIANKAQEKFTIETCKVANKAIRFCVPSTKIVTQGEHDPLLGGQVGAYDPENCLQNDFLCYKVFPKSY